MDRPGKRPGKMRKVNNNYQLVKLGAIICGGFSMLLGFMVIVGWYTRNVTLIQVLPIFVPMQYNTALGFLLCGAGILTMVFGYKRLALVCSGIAFTIGCLTLVQYIFGADFGIDQLLMRHYVTVETSHPGRMAPNTALCFGITGTGLLVLCCHKLFERRYLIAGLLGPVVAALGTVAFFGYISSVETAYGWGELTRMAVHTAIGFIVLGTGIFTIAWRQEISEKGRIPPWIAFPVGIGMATIALVQWQALMAHEPTLAPLPIVVLIVGAAMAVLLTLTVHLSQKLWNRTKQIEQTNKKLENEINRRQQLEEQLRHAQKMEAIGTLAGGIAHDFNNVLGAIMGYTELAVLDIPDHSITKTNLEHVVAATHRAKEMVKQILAFSRKDEKEKKPVQLNEIVAEAIGLLRNSLPTTIEIRSTIEENLGPILANSTQVHQVIMNLCTNSAHAMGEEGGVLEIKLKEIEVDLSTTDVISTIGNKKIKGSGVGRFLHLTVSDTGHGMDAETIERIFEPYFTTKKIGEGTGMGLAVVHGIVKNHRGEIKVYSEKGKGTTIHIFFPLEEDKQRKKALQEQPIQKIRGGNECILLVDDMPHLVEMVKQMLERIGYQVNGKISSLDALEAFRQTPGKFDMVITDQTMPKMTGVQLTQEIKRIKPNTPVILLTGFSGSVNEKNFKKQGIDAFLMKPIISKDIAQAIRDVLDRKPKS